MRDSMGRFLAGPDPDRHELTRQERQRGFANMLAAPMPSRVRAHIRRKIRQRYRGCTNPRVLAHIEAHRRIYGEAV